MEYQDIIDKRAKELASQALLASEGKFGYEAGELVCQFFKDHTDHPHPQYTFEKMAMDRPIDQDGTILFPTNLACELGRLVAENEMLNEGGNNG